MGENMILSRLQGVKARFEEVGQLITDPSIIADMDRYVKLNREYKQLEPVVKAMIAYRDLLSNIQNAKKMLAEEKDEELREMARDELELYQEQLDPLEEDIKMLLLPEDPEDEKSAIVEIRAGTGGDEASIFAGDLYRMYTKYFESKGWRASTTSFTEGTVGGFKEIILNVDGDGVYGTMKYESGVHRVQRVPQTETQGRVHTSAATVAVLPEAEDFDIEVKQSDIRKDTYCSSGPGGQSVNTTYSAIRLTHIHRDSGNMSGREITAEEPG